jgi:hypothetical protein
MLIVVLWCSSVPPGKSWVSKMKQTRITSNHILINLLFPYYPVSVSHYCRVIRVNIDRIWNGNQIYWTLTYCNYK